MNQEKQALKWRSKQRKIAGLRRQLANLSPELKAELTNRGLIATVGGRTLSQYNTLMVYLQMDLGMMVTWDDLVVGGFKQWKAAGRQVQKGQHGLTILFPIGDKDKDTGDILSATRFYSGTVFDISQTEAVGKSTQLAPLADMPPVQAPLQADNNIMKGWSLV